MDAGGIIESIAISQDGKWIVSGTWTCGQVTVWDAESHEKVNEFKGHEGVVYAVDISPDATRIATGSGDKTACVWSLSTGERLLSPFEHEREVAAVKFSPDGRLIATAAWDRASVRLYDSRDGHCLVTLPIRVSSTNNQSLAWVGDSKRLFVLSGDGNIYCLDVSTGQTLSKWAFHGNHNLGCISLAKNGAFVAASAGSTVSFWDTTTHKQIGSVIHHPARVSSMAISANYDLVIGGQKTITLWNLQDALSSPYSDNVSVVSPDTQRQ